MGDITIQLGDATGNERIDVEVPDDVTVGPVLVVLTGKLHLPEHRPAGQPMRYNLHHRRLRVQRLDDQPLVEQQMDEPEILRFQPEITACGDLP